MARTTPAAPGVMRAREIQLDAVHAAKTQYAKDARALRQSQRALSQAILKAVAAGVDDELLGQALGVTEEQAARVRIKAQNGG